MANYYGQGRTNTFAVRDVAALKAALADYEIEVIERDDSQVTLLANSEDGDFSVWTLDDEGDTEDAVFIPDIIADHLQDGQIAVFVHSGWEKIRATCPRGVSQSTPTGARFASASTTSTRSRRKFSTWIPGASASPPTEHLAAPLGGSPLENSEADS